MRNVICSLSSMLIFSPISSDDSVKAGLNKLTLEYERTESFVGAVIPLLIIWIIYLVYMIVTKKEKGKIIQSFSMGLFFLAIWALIYLIIF